ncbi:MAG: Sir2 family NAD-dependent protein deacetylase [Desulfosarcina sp.]
MLNQNTKKLKQYIEAATTTTVFTGAGISAESGIPTYRGEDGLWNRYDPAKFADIGYFFKDPAYYWNFFKDIRYPVISAATPNAAHTTLAALEKNGLVNCLITQNIDGLHQLSGSRKVVELHGNTRRVKCLKCRSDYSMDEVFGMLELQLPPLCPDCRGTLKPDVVFFGEPMPTDALEQALTASRECDLFLVIGSSLVVQPAASLPAIAKQNGARLIIINKDPTPLDGVADMVVHTLASTALAGMAGSLNETVL